MNLRQLIETEELDPRGVKRYLDDCQRSDTLGRPRDPEAIKQTRRYWPSRFNPDGSLMAMRERTTTLLEPYVPKPTTVVDDPTPELF